MLTLLQIAFAVVCYNQVTGIIVMNTTNDFRYGYLEDSGYFLSDATEITFGIRAINDAHVALSTNLNDWRSDSYEVVLGGWSNGRSVIRKCDQCNPKTEFSHSALTADRYMYFWVGWKNGTIRVGNGTEAYRHEFMHWFDPEPHEVNHVGFSTGWGSNGSWVIDYESPSWLTWISWSACDASCNISQRVRMRECNQSQPLYNLYCNGSAVEYEECTVPPCPIDGQWSDWSNWTDCSTTCDFGVQSRIRDCDDPAPQYSGEDCPAEPIHERECFIGPCPVNGSWSDWSEWSTCSVTCGGGMEMRSRHCDDPTPQFGGLNCSGNDTEEKECNTDHCPIDGNWSEWSSWTPCSVSCGGGNQTRSRDCNDPAPQYGGRECDGEANSSTTCNTHPCPIAGNWGDWSFWSMCTASCGGGESHRFRFCDHPSPQYGGEECHGNNTDIQTCQENPCPVDGAWTAWSGWSSCTSTCDDGLKYRERYCTEPEPQYGGSQCPGNATQKADCFEVDCPIDGVWSAWSGWSACSENCGWGRSNRTRLCDNPSPQYDGEYCHGNATDSRQCLERECPVDGQWTTWSRWSACSISCEYGIRHRHRSCTDPPPQFGGASCENPSFTEETENCFERKCPRDGGWSSWSDWSSCSKSCEKGLKTRQRECDNPLPINDGLMCPGTALQNHTCNFIDCPSKETELHTEEKPTEAPGAVGIGTTGIVFCLILVAIIIIMDMDTLRQQRKFMRANLTVFRKKFCRKNKKRYIDKGTRSYRSSVGFTDLKTISEEKQNSCGVQNSTEGTIRQNNKYRWHNSSYYSNSYPTTFSNGGLSDTVLQNGSIYTYGYAYHRQSNYRYNNMEAMDEIATRL